MTDSISAVGDERTSAVVNQHDAIAGFVGEAHVELSDGPKALGNRLLASCAASHDVGHLR